MRRVILVSLVILCTISAACASGPYVPAGDILIGGPLPAFWDFVHADGAGRLFVSHGTEVVVIDTASRQIIGRIADTPVVHGTATGGGRIFTSNARGATVSVVDPVTFATIKKVESGGDNPDAITFDRRRNELWVFNHGGASASLFTPAGERVAVIPLSGAPESGAADGEGRVFVNIEKQNHVDVIDVPNRQVVAHWPVAPGEEPTGMAYGAASRRLFVGAGSHMVMMDAGTGRVVSSVPVCYGTDATFYDPSSKLAFSSCREGRITIARVEGDTMTVVQTIRTSPESKTMALDPVTHALYVPAAMPDLSTSNDELDPSTFRVMVYHLR